MLQMCSGGGAQRGVITMPGRTGLTEEWPGRAVPCEGAAPLPARARAVAAKGASRT